MTDPVNHPSHYKLFPDMEAIDAIEGLLTPEEYRGYLKGNCLKYRLRAGNKGDTQQDIDKSEWYRRRLHESVELQKRMFAALESLEAGSKTEMGSVPAKKDQQAATGGMAKAAE